MATVTLYAFSDTGYWGEVHMYGSSTYTTFNYEKAKELARKNRMLIIGHEYEWVDSETLDDFRPSRPEDDDETSVGEPRPDEI